MTVYDKNAYRIAEIESAVRRGKSPSEKGAEQIARLKAKAPEYWVKGYAYGKTYNHKVPGNAHSLKVARAYEMRLKVQIADRTYSPAELLRVRLRDIFTAHLKAQTGRGGESAARTRCKHANRVFGAFRLEQLHERPKDILEKGFAALPATWAPKTRWQVRVFMRAAISRYLKENPKILMNNPVDAFPLPHGTRNREVYPTLEEHQAVLTFLKQNPFRWVPGENGKGPRKAGFPAYLVPLLTIKYEQGLRNMEIMPWRFEKADLDMPPRNGKFPAVLSRILKKGGKNAEQWIVLTATSYKALRTYLSTLSGHKEHGPIWPVRNWPHALVRRALNACGLTHLWAHDYRRAWTMSNIDKPTERRLAAVGRKTEESEAVYKHFNRAEQEVFYAQEWDAWERAQP